MDGTVKGRTFGQALRDAHEQAGRLWVEALERVLMAVCWSFDIDEPADMQARVAVVHYPPTDDPRRAYVTVDGSRATPDLCMWLDGTTWRIEMMEPR